MMRLLLDTHALLWFYSGDDMLPDELGQRIRNPATTCYISVASLWEITIKISLGKLELSTPIEHHKDPFDRLIIAQALAENLAVATKDSFFSHYGLTRQW